MLCRARHTAVEHRDNVKNVSQTGRQCGDFWAAGSDIVALWRKAHKRRKARPKIYPHSHYKRVMFPTRRGFLSLQVRVFEVTSVVSATGQAAVPDRTATTQSNMSSSLHAASTWILAVGMTRKQSARKPKSWNGCIKCRAARRKCSEEKPSCAYCLRNDLECQVPSFPSQGQGTDDCSVRFELPVSSGGIPGLGRSITET